MGVERSPSIRSDVEQASQAKDASKHSEFQHRGGMSQEDAEFLDNFPEAKKKKAVRKVDVSIYHKALCLFTV